MIKQNLVGKSSFVQSKLSHHYHIYNLKYIPLTHTYTLSIPLLPSLSLDINLPRFKFAFSLSLCQSVCMSLSTSLSVSIHHSINLYIMYFYLSICAAIKFSPFICIITYVYISICLYRKSEGNIAILCINVRELAMKWLAMKRQSGNLKRPRIRS